ncbi:MAG TPA: pyridoxal phosphate-dependent aminotransferase [Terriglobales bacterium]|nr:pyridoxal phosphate-dependent aminotransferase [Terriglobales bacterium]
MFSARTGWPLAPNRLHTLAQARRAAGTLLDLTVSNPTVCGFDYPQAALLSALGQAAALRYEPAPLGLAAARRAVAGYYAERGVAVALDRLLLTASTSEAYAHLFRLLCDPGDNVLMPSPSYPLFEMLAGVHDVRLTAVPMMYDQGWQLDLAGLEAAATPQTRALLLVHPNNPAGSYLKPHEWARLQTLAAERGWALVLDEVFCDYALPPAAPVELGLERPPALTFVLNGFSKILALPQMKLAWIGVHGPPAACAEAMARLEVVNDLFLSVDAPIQYAAAAMLGARGGIQAQIRARLQANLRALDAVLALLPALRAAERLRVEGGWSVMLRLPRIHTDEAWAELLLERTGVLTHPGHFYGLAAESHLAFSLLPPAADFAAAAGRLGQAIAAELG